MTIVLAEIIIVIIVSGGNVVFKQLIIGSNLVRLTINIYLRVPYTFILFSYDVDPR